MVHSESMFVRLNSEKRILQGDALSYVIRLNTLLARKHELNLNDVQIKFTTHEYFRICIDL